MKLTYKQFLNNLRFNDENSIIFLMSLKYKIFYIKFIEKYNRFHIYWNTGNDENKPYPSVRMRDTLYETYKFFKTLIKEESAN